MAELLFTGEEKKSSGTGNSRALRRNGRIPAIVYGFRKNYTISLVYKDFIKEYLKGNVLSRLISIKIGKKRVDVVPREIQTDPITDMPIHIDFQLIKDDIHVKIPVLVQVINKDKSPGIKRGGILNTVNKYVDLNCIPRNIPSFLQVDISGLDIGSHVHINDIKMPNGVVPINKSNFTILTITGRIEEKEEELEKGDVSENSQQKEETK